MSARLPPEYLTLGQMTQGSGCTPRTIRHYERLGLITAQRSSGGHRLFAPQELERLQLIVRLREAGFSLEEVGELFTRRTHTSDATACGELGELLASHITRLQRKLAILHSLADDLGTTRAFLSTCETCTDDNRPASCAICSRVPQVEERPLGLRLLFPAEREDCGSEVVSETRPDSSAKLREST